MKKFETEDPTDPKDATYRINVWRRKDARLNLWGLKGVTDPRYSAKKRRRWGRNKIYDKN